MQASTGRSLPAILTFVVLMAAAFGAADLIVGASLERNFLLTLEGNPDLSWADRHFAARNDETEIPNKGDKIRILYLSNSHALTGGRVSKHLQSITDRFCPNRLEIIDLSSAGMFAPEYLQRFAAATNYEISAVVLPVSYISFSDRMPLSRQALTARSMFKPDVLPHLPVGFWLRNWDIGVYSDAAVSQILRIYRYRNDLRDIWERPLSNRLKAFYSVPTIRFLEVDERKGWRFPDGFDTNLFNWKLYRGDRDRHLADMSSLVDLAKEKGVTIVASNLPIHWQKERRPVDSKDVAEYKLEVGKLFAPAQDYVDYDDDFPKEFTTYDALHPTWHGARLHAFDLALRLNKQNLIPCPATDHKILEAFLSSDEALSVDFVSSLNQPKELKAKVGFRRFDVTEPSNARDLLARATAEPIFSPATQLFLTQLALRVRYWTESDFRPIDGSVWTRGVRGIAFDTEKDRAKIRSRNFVNALAQSLSPQLARFPIPTVNDVHILGENIAISSEGRRILTREYLLPDGNKAYFSIDVETDRNFSVIVHDVASGLVYERVDVLGDRSFMQVHLSPQTVHIPSWVSHSDPIVEFGV